jgi:hypothetical protein
MSSESSITAVDIKYSKIVNKLLKYICEVRRKSKDALLFDIIYDFCFKHHLDFEEVGDAVRNDVYLSELVLDECRLARMVKKNDTDNVQLAEDW